MSTRSAVVLAVASALAAPLVAQDDGPPATVPFGPGETASYRVTLGLFGTVGEGAMEVVDVEDVRGHRTYHLRLTVEGGVLFAKVDDTLESWLDVNGLFSRRFLQNQREVGHRRHRQYDLYPEDRRWASMTFREDTLRDGGELLHTDVPLDDVSFLYFVRTIPLEVGETYVFERYFKERGNPVKLEVLRRDTVEVGAGTFPVIVVKPIIQTEGLFSEGGNAEVYFSDDSRRLVVQLKSSVPVIGSLNLYLQDYTPGRRLVQKPFDTPLPPE